MIPTGSTNDFLLSDPFIVSVFVQHVRTKAVTSHLFTPLFMFIHLPANDLPIFCILLCIIMHLLLFLSPDWLTFCHMIISHI